ncbi:hypothetical protein [Legionella spiritensis]|uniref:hypothetical protein n=1 Tax=Legionella spiritensis TaxID=452 RepID=UPI000F6F4295|nr:hypothetical protein [Legionella spiritensis]VEG89652.1 Uncharacterised protein [Legionella spiritensis]
MRNITFILLLLISSITQAKNTIVDYQRIFLPVYTADGQLLMALRVFKMNDVPSFLVVNPDNLETKVIPIQKLYPRQAKQQKKPGYFTHWNIASTRYYQLLNKNTASPYPLKNQGVTHAEHAEKGNVLTIDLCPSSKPFETEFFNGLIKLSDKAKEPIPITIAISGMWLIEHPNEFQWLLTQEKNGKLLITWANHSFSHAYYSDLPYSQNFLLSEGTNLDMEVLLTEKYLLEEGEFPSVFFRFPGLVSDNSLIKKIKQYGLIPLGADAWLAKHQEITPGGIILVHGNSNEHEGIVELTPQLQRLELVDIKNSV